MPRKKRTRRRDDAEGEDEPLVISDSENEPEEELRPKSTSREARLRGREARTPTRALCADRDVVPAELTEEEMVELAVRLSEREAGNAALRRQRQEEEDMRLAIEQSLHANGIQAPSKGFESSPLVMTPVRGSHPSAGQSPTPAAESPTFPPGRKSLSLSLSNRKRDMASEDRFTSSTGVGVAQRGMLGNPPSQSGDLPESPPIGSDTPALAPPTSEAVGPNQGEAMNSDSDGKHVFSSLADTSSQCPVLRIEKLSPSLEQDCQSAGFVLYSQSDPAQSTATGAAVAAPPSPSPCRELPRSPTFPAQRRSEPPSIVRPSRAAAYLPESAAVAAAVCVPSEASPPPHRRGPSPRSPSFSERTHGSPSEPLKRRGVVLKGKREDCSRDHGESDREQNQGSMSCQQSHSVSEHTAAGPLRVALWAEQEFSTQMTLNWEDNEGEESPAENEECPTVAQTRSPPRSQSALCGQSCYSDTESLLRDVPIPVLSPVFLRDPPRNPVTPLGGRASLSALREGVSGAVGGVKGVRRKMTFQNMYAAPSPVAPSALGQPSCSAWGRVPGTSPAPLAPPLKEEEQGAGRVLYHWGVPFCPWGQDPDNYTHVILTQLEVYEKSLKAARRGLLRKAEWGEPVLPGPPKRPLCRRARLKRPRPARPLLTEEEEDEEGEEGEDPGEAVEVEEERGASQRGPEAGGGDGEGGAAPDCEALGAPSQTLLLEPNASLDSDSLPEEPLDKFKNLRRRALRDRSPPRPETQQLLEVQEEEEEEEEEAMCPETQLSGENTQDVNMESPAGSQPRPDSEVMEVEQQQQEVEAMHSQPKAAAAAGAKEATMEVELMEQEEQEEAQARGGRVECPICMCSFPPSEIEMHAAYCDGTAVTEETCSQAMVPRRNARRTDRTRDDQPSSRSTRAPLQEKCFLCHGLFQVQEYDSHVEACILQKSSRTNQGTKSLLTALERSEQRDSEAGPSNSFRRKESRYSLSAGQSGGSSSIAAGYSVSDSPIKAFTPISEATDCLVDFKRQYTSKPTQRAGRKRKFRK